MLFTIALLPWILILAYESVANHTWETRHYSRLTLGCFLAVIFALAL